MNNALKFARNKLSIKEFRLAVATFNQRTIKVYKKVGFKKERCFERIADN